MKKKPASFSITYSDVSSEHLYSGFEAIKTEEKYIYERTVEISPRIWKYGGYLQVKIIDKAFYHKDDKTVFENVCEYSIYDDDIDRDYIQKLLIGGRANNEITGSVAESIVHSLYLDLIVSKNLYNFSHYLPEIYNKIKLLKEQK